MKINDEFPNIDTSYWKVDDKEWFEERKRSWESIERYYYGGREKSKKGMNIIKRYYLKGEVPDFKALREWDDLERHLDLYSFLWLHPSKDKEILAALRDIYVNSPLIVEFDIRSGLRILFDSGFLIPTYEPSDIDVERAFYSGGNNLLMFTVILGDLSKDHYPDDDHSSWKIEKFNMGYHYIIEYGKWLCVKKPNYLSEDCLYQYDEYLQYWLECCRRDSHFFNSGFDNYKPHIVKSLHRINRFDVEKEGDTARGRFAIKIREILDEHDFHPVLKQLWEEVKNDSSDVKGLWRL